MLIDKRIKMIKSFSLIIVLSFYFLMNHFSFIIDFIITKKINLYNRFHKNKNINHHFVITDVISYSFSNNFTMFFSFVGISILYGQRLTHFPQFMHSLGKTFEAKYLVSAQLLRL